MASGWAAFRVRARASACGACVCARHGEASSQISGSFTSQSMVRPSCYSEEPRWRERVRRPWQHFDA